MNSNSSLRISVLTFALLGLLGLGGCKDTGPNYTEFFPQGEVQSVNSTLDRQVANGARHDAMLRPQHFDGDRLNALGRTKLDHMLQADSGPMTVYLPESADATHELVAARRLAILAYAKDRGRAEADVHIVDGINPGTLHPASADLTRLPKTELGGKEGGASSNDGAADLGMNGMSGNNPAAPNSTGKVGG
jgi:hypothetical protein